MHQIVADEFERFTAQRKKDLQRIARHTRGEHQLADVVHEAWILAWSLQASSDAPLDLADRSCQEKLLSHLYQHLVRYTEQNVRRAIRLDHAPKGGGQNDDVHPLNYLLMSNEGRDALSELLEREAALALQIDLDAHGSLAAAYVRLLQHFDNRMSAVAEHLLISKSYAYRCCAHARWLATHMAHIPVPMPGGRLIPGPWRRFRLRRAPVQMAFDFDDELPLRSNH